MAKIFYNLKQNKVKTSKIYGKWFAIGKTIETLKFIVQMIASIATAIVTALGATSCVGA